MVELPGSASPLGSSGRGTCTPFDLAARSLGRRGFGSIEEPVGHINLAPTFAAIAGIDPDERFQDSPLPPQPGSRHERAICTWDDQPGDHATRTATIVRRRYVRTRYDRSGYYGGDEGELYDLENDPLQWENRWLDLSYTRLKDDLLADLRDHLPQQRMPPLAKVARA